MKQCPDCQQNFTDVHRLFFNIDNTKDKKLHVFSKYLVDAMKSLENLTLNKSDDNSNAMEKFGQFLMGDRVCADSVEILDQILGDKKIEFTSSFFSIHSNISSFKEKLAIRDNMLEIANDREKNFSQQLNERQSEINQMQQQCKQFENEKLQQHHKTISYEDDIGNMKEELKIANNRVKDLTQQLTKHRSEIDKLQQQVEQRKSDMNNMQKELDKGKNSALTTETKATRTSKRIRKTISKP